MGRTMNDMKCRLIQKAVYAKLYKGHHPNEWEPWKEPGITKTDDGIICKNDVKYGNSFPNSFADIWYPDDSLERKPVVVYFHGGGFIFGDKTSGDPLAANDGNSCKLKEIVKAGYILVNANYALAPDYRFPTQIQQTDELFRYLITHEEELHLDMNHVCLSGGSAGANITEIYAACVCNPEYGKIMSVNPVMTTENLRVLAIDEAALDPSVFDKNMFTMLGCVAGCKSNNVEEIAYINAKNYIRDRYIPSWINASNEPSDERGYFITEGRGLKNKLDEIGVPNELVFFPGANLPHGYMDQMEANPKSKEAFDRMMSFIKRFI